MQIEGLQNLQTTRPTELIFDADLPESPQSKPSEPTNEPVSVGKKASSVIQFSQDQVSGKMLMRLVNPETNEVIRQIPPEELVAISRLLGLIFDRVA